MQSPLIEEFEDFKTIVGDTQTKIETFQNNLKADITKALDLQLNFLCKTTAKHPCKCLPTAFHAFEGEEKCKTTNGIVNANLDNMKLHKTVVGDFVKHENVLL